MPNDIRYRRSVGNKLRFSLRFLGITGIFAAAAGFALYQSLGLAWDRPTIELAAHCHLGRTATAASYLMAIGLLLAVLSLLVELFSGFGKAAGRRSAVGANAALQIVLAVGIFAAVNVYSFHFARRWDLTKEKQFTLPNNVVEELRKLRGETKIVVLQLKSTFGRFSKEPDSYDNAAETVVVEKVRDLVDEFRQLGPQFQVSILDRKNEDFDRKLDEITVNDAKLKEAIQAAPESSIFFAAGDKVQRLGLNEFYQLDKTASKAANDKKGNLVLRPQGLEPFVNRITAIQERKPRVGLAIIHPILASQKAEDSEEGYTSYGLRKALESYGFEVVDIVLKKWGEAGPPAPAAFNFEETKLERAENELDGLNSELREMNDEMSEAQELLKIFQIPKIEELRETLAKKFRVRGEITEENRKKQVESLKEALDMLGKSIAEKKAEQETKRRDLDAMLNNEQAFADRRVSDVKAKFTRMANDCDLLVIPRMTIINPADQRVNIPPRVYGLSKEQIDVVKDYMKSGKPVLALIGPNNGPASQPYTEPDDLEKLLVDRGVELGKQAILFEADTKAFAVQLAGEQFGGKQTEVPAVAFKINDDKNPSPLSRAMLATGQSADQALEIRVRAPRPVYLLPGYQAKQKFAGEFVFVTAADSWNDEKPILSESGQGGRGVYRPRFEAARYDDPKKGTRDEKRRGPFPIGVAVESKIPIEWVDADYANTKAISGLLGGVDQGIMAACLTAASEKVKRPTERLAVIGQGGIFTKPDLGPAKEKLLLHTVNWLLGREDRLPSADEKTWEYPRVELTEKQKSLWHYGTFLGLPALFAYLGIIVLMIRKLR